MSVFIKEFLNFEQFHYLLKYTFNCLGFPLPFYMLDLMKLFFLKIHKQLLVISFIKNLNFCKFLKSFSIFLITCVMTHHEEITFHFLKILLP